MVLQSLYCLTIWRLQLHLSFVLHICIVACLHCYTLSALLNVCIIRATRIIYNTIMWWCTNRHTHAHADWRAIVGDSCSDWNSPDGRRVALELSQLLPSIGRSFTASEGDGCRVLDSAIKKIQSYRLVYRLRASSVTLGHFKEFWFSDINIFEIWSLIGWFRSVNSLQRWSYNALDSAHSKQSAKRTVQRLVEAR